MTAPSFRPTANLATLQRRADLLQKVRAFFAEKGVLEVDVPTLGLATVTDPHITALRSGDYFLQTSPEFYMKRLLAAGAPSIFSLGKAFRADERGARHLPEFTLLEWYCLGFTDRELIAQLVALLALVAPGQGVRERPYGEVFEALLGLCPYRASETALRAVALREVGFGGELVGKAAWLDLLFSHCVEPKLGDGFTIVTEFPVEQCALAKLATNAQGLAVARRFELYGAGLELANGYWELTDAREQLARFERDQVYRREQGLEVPAIDQRFIAALQHGLPECAGVALGVDRLLMVLAPQRHIAAVVPFAHG